MKTKNMQILNSEKYINEKLDIKPVTKERLDDMKNMFDSYVVRLSLWSKSFMCKFGNSDWVDLVETNQDIFGKTVKEFKGDYGEIVWDLDVNTGLIKGWNNGDVVVGFKVVDGGSYTLMKDGKIVTRKMQVYVPKFLQIDENGWDDYIQITIGADGYIKDWGDKQRAQVFDFFWS